MQTVSSAELRDSLPNLLKQVQDEPVVIRDEGQDVAILVAPTEFEATVRKLNFERFMKLRDEISASLEEKLAKEGRTVDEFLADVLES